MACNGKCLILTGSWHFIENCEFHDFELKVILLLLESLISPTILHIAGARIHAFPKSTSIEWIQTPLIEFELILPTPFVILITNTALVPLKL